MLERFYDPLVGGVYADGHEISSLNINNYRSYLALVSQEPTLYQGTIRDNILLGADTKPEDVPEEASGDITSISLQTEQGKMRVHNIYNPLSQTISGMSRCTQSTES